MMNFGGLRRLGVLVQGSEEADHPEAKAPHRQGRPHPSEGGAVQLGVSEQSARR
jgi:hypothetical protein